MTQSAHRASLQSPSVAASRRSIIYVILNIQSFPSSRP